MSQSTQYKSTLFYEGVQTSLNPVGVVCTLHAYAQLQHTTYPTLMPLTDSSKLKPTLENPTVDYPLTYVDAQHRYLVLHWPTYFRMLANVLTETDITLISLEQARLLYTIFVVIYPVLASKSSLLAYMLPHLFISMHNSSVKPEALELYFVKEVLTELQQDTETLSDVAEAFDSFLTNYPYKHTQSKVRESLQYHAAFKRKTVLDYFLNVTTCFPEHKLSAPLQNTDNTKFTPTHLTPYKFFPHTVSDASPVRFFFELANALHRYIDNVEGDQFIPIKALLKQGNTTQATLELRHLTIAFGITFDFTNDRLVVELRHIPKPLLRQLVYSKYIIKQNDFDLRDFCDTDIDLLNNSTAQDLVASFLKDLPAKHYNTNAILSFTPPERKPTYFTHDKYRSNVLYQQWEESINSSTEVEFLVFNRIPFFQGVDRETKSSLVTYPVLKDAEFTRLYGAVDYYFKYRHYNIRYNVTVTRYRYQDIDWFSFSNTHFRKLSNFNAQGYLFVKSLGEYVISYDKLIDYASDLDNYKNTPFKKVMSYITFKKMLRFIKIAILVPSAVPLDINISPTATEQAAFITSPLPPEIPTSTYDILDEDIAKLYTRIINMIAHKKLKVQQTTTVVKYILKNFRGSGAVRRLEVWAEKRSIPVNRSTLTQDVRTLREALLRRGVRNIKYIPYTRMSKKIIQQTLEAQVED